SPSRTPWRRRSRVASTFSWTAAGLPARRLPPLSMRRWILLQSCARARIGGPEGRARFRSPMGVIKTYNGKTPVLGERVYLAETAAVIGDVVLSDDVSIWYNAVVRADCHYIRVGPRSNIQDNCAIHVTEGRYPTVLEEEVTLGHGAIVHGAVVRR